MKIIPLVITLLMSPMLVNFASSQSSAVADHSSEEMINYWAYMALITDWSAETSQKLMELVKSEKKEPAFLFGGVVEIQKRTLKLFNVVKVPALTDLKDYHQKHIEVAELVIEAFSLSVEQRDEFSRLQAQAAAKTAAIDDMDQKLKDKYGVTADGIDKTLQSGKLDTKAIESIINDPLRK